MAVFMESLVAAACDHVISLATRSADYTAQPSRVTCRVLSGDSSTKRGHRFMAMQNEHIASLLLRAPRKVVERRSVVGELTEEYKRDHTEHMREQLAKMQTAIGATNEAIADEQKIAAGQAKNTSVPRQDMTADERHKDIPTGGGIIK